MTYEKAIKYLFDSAPMFQNVGAAAYKEGLGGTLFLDEHFGHPHRNYRCIHVGGTNGKGSVTHTLAAILQAQGYRVGLYTSPHLVDFRERIRVNGKMISKKRVIDFVEQEHSLATRCPRLPAKKQASSSQAFLSASEKTSTKRLRLSSPIKHKKLELPSLLPKTRTAKLSNCQIVN